MFSVSLFTLLLLLLLLLLWHIFCLVGIQFIWGKFGDFEVGSFWLAPNSNPPPFPFSSSIGFNSVSIRFRFGFDSIAIRSHQSDCSSVSVSYLFHGFISVTFRFQFGSNSVSIQFQFGFISISSIWFQFSFNQLLIGLGSVWDRFGIGLGFSLGSNRWINSRKLTGKLKQLIWIRFQFNPVRSRSIPLDPVRSCSIPWIMTDDSNDWLLSLSRFECSFSSLVFGLALDSGWIPVGFRLDSGWIPAGFRLQFRCAFRSRSPFHPLTDDRIGNLILAS